MRSWAERRDQAEPPGTDDRQAGAREDPLDGEPREHPAVDRKIEAAKRAEADERRSAARDQREQVENVRQSAESLAETVRISAELPKRAAETAQETINGTLSAATQVAQRTAEQVSRTWRGAAENVTAVVQANSALAARYQEIWGEWLALSQQATRERIEAAGRVAFAPTPQSALEAQFTMVRRKMELFLERNARLAQLSARAALDARQRIDETADERRAA